MHNLEWADSRILIIVRIALFSKTLLAMIHKWNECLLLPVWQWSQRKRQNVSVLPIAMKWLTMLLASFVFDFSWATQINSNTVFTLYTFRGNEEPTNGLIIFMVSARGATDRRWSVIRTDQSPRFGTHVIRGLTDKFNHHRVKVYLLHVLRFLRSAAAAHTEARTRREREWEREVWFRYRVSDNASTDGYIHTHKVMLKYPFWQVFW